MFKEIKKKLQVNEFWYDLGSIVFNVFHILFFYKELPNVVIIIWPHVVLYNSIRWHLTYVTMHQLFDQL